MQGHTKCTQTPADQQLLSQHLSGEANYKHAVSAKDNSIKLSSDIMHKLLDTAGRHVSILMLKFI